VDDLVQLLLFGAIILFGIFGSRKKKSQQMQKRRPQPRPQRPRVELPERRPVSPPATARSPQRRRGLAEELFEALRQQMEEPQRPEVVEPPPPPPPPAPLPPPMEEAVSLEVLEPAGEASHRRFHDLYMDQQPAPKRSPDRHRDERAYEDRTARKKRMELTRNRLQHAFVMKEIIGPPKGLEETRE
jgi:hypothetical protein